MEAFLFELVQSALGLRDSLSDTVPAEAWRDLYKMAAGQALLGITYAGLSRMYDSDGTEYAVQSNRAKGLAELPVGLFYEWMNRAYVIQNTNARFNRRCIELQESVNSYGLRNFIMKGQGNAALYGDLAMLRQSGDIDLYVDGGYRKVLEFVKSVKPTDKINELEIQFGIFDDTAVEIHFRPFVLRNPFKNRKLQYFFRKECEACFANRVALAGGEGVITASTTKFNLVHQIVHIFHHLFTEGIGLRQLMDYYYLLINASDDDIRNVRKEVGSLGMERFASALMSVLKWVFCLESSRMPWPENEADGRFLLDAVMKSGNFGMGDNTHSRLLSSRWTSFRSVSGKAFRYARFDRWMWFWSPVWRISHYVWRKINNYR